MDLLGLRRAQQRRDEIADPAPAASAPASSGMSQADFFKKPDDTPEQKALKAKKLAEMLRRG